MMAKDGSFLGERLSALQIDPRLLDLPESHPEFNPVDIYRCFVSAHLANITGIDRNTIYTALQWTQSLERGDLILAVPRLRVKLGTPSELAKRWAEEFPQNNLVQPPAASAANLSFAFSPASLSSLVLSNIFQLGDRYGSNPAAGLKDPKDPSAGRKRIIVEFSSPNIAKEFHAGHLRSTIIGAFLSNLFEASGWEVIRMNYLGDWGRQYGLIGVGWNKFGSEEALRSNGIAHLYDIYVKISALFKPEEDACKLARKNGEDVTELETSGLLGEVKDYFKAMEEGDKEKLALWERFRTMSIERYKLSYSRLNIVFDEYSGESQIKTSSMNDAEAILKDRGAAEMNEGATIVDFAKQGAPKLDRSILRNNNGTTNYLLRDVGAAIERAEKFSFDKMIYVVMSQQDVHLARLFKILELMGGKYKEISDKLQHVNFGAVKGMSTRKGNVRFLDDILQECATAMHEVMQRNAGKYAQVEEPEKVADILGISAVMVQDMSGKRVNGYPFDISRMTSFEGDTGPYLQYAHARLCSVARKAGYSRQDILDADTSLLQEPHAVNLIRLLAQYPDTVAHSLKTLEPTTILTYLFRLTHQLSSSYDVLRVVGAPEGPDTSLARAALYEAARQVLSNGMRLLGLTPVDRM